MEEQKIIITTTRETNANKLCEFTYKDLISEFESVLRISLYRVLIEVESLR